MKIMEIKKYIENDMEYIKGKIKSELDNNLKKIVNISLKNIERVEKVEVSSKNYDLEFHIIFYKDSEETDFIILDEDCGIFNFEGYTNFLMDNSSISMSNRLLDIIYDDKYLVEPLIPIQDKNN